MNTQVPVITLDELAENAEFICEVLVARNKMSFRVVSDDQGDVLLIPVIEKSPVPANVLADIEEMQKSMITPDVNFPSSAPLDMPF